jgi:hypothetical protein
VAKKGFQEEGLPGVALKVICPRGNGAIAQQLGFLAFRALNFLPVPRFGFFGRR